jgi:hypothetical protein
MLICKKDSKKFALQVFINFWRTPMHFVLLLIYFFIIYTYTGSHGNKTEITINLRRGRPSSPDMAIAIPVTMENTTEKRKRKSSKKVTNKKTIA